MRKLQAVVPTRTAEQRMVERARVILLSHEGLTVEKIAERQRTRPARVSKWRQLRGASFTSARQLRDAIDAFVEVYNQKAVVRLTAFFLGPLSSRICRSSVER